MNGTGRISFLTLILAALLLAASGRTAGDDLLSQVRTCEDLRTLAAAIDAYSIESNFFPSSDRVLLPSDRLAPLLGTRHAPEANPLDPWGNPYLYWSNRKAFLLIGTGFDGQPDKNYVAALAEDLDATDALANLCSKADPAPGADVVFAAGQFCKLPPEVAFGKAGQTFSEADRQALTMKNIRIVATTVEEYSIDNNVYAVLSRGATGVSALKPLVVPIYAKDLPVADGWGQGLLYWSNGDHYVIQSQVAGMDLDYAATLADSPQFEERVKEICKGATSDPRADIVFIDGQFCQWPTGQTGD